MLHYELKIYHSETKLFFRQNLRIRNKFIVVVSVAYTHFCISTQSLGTTNKLFIYLFHFIHSFKIEIDNTDNNNN